MVDPFFAQQAAQQAAQQPPQAQPPVAPQLSQQAQAQIQVLLQQQAFLQQQYAQLGQVVQSPQTTPAQKQQAQLQGQQINQQYIQISQQLQQLGYVPSRVNKPVVAQNKSGSKLSLKGFLLGCFVLFVVVMGGLVGIFYYLMNNPSQLTSIGLDPATTKNLLQAFSVVFFGLLVFLGMGMVIVNAYRLVSVKNKPKLGYGIGFFFGLLIFIGGLFIGSKVITTIKGLSVGTAVDANKLVVPYVYLKQGWTSPLSDPTFVFIAPSLIAYKLNTEYFTNQVMPLLGQVTITSGSLDCGNGQTIPLNITTAQFDGNCIFFKKGSYPLNLMLSYTNVATAEKADKTIPAGSLDFASEIVVSPVEGDLARNDSHTEMLVGKVPSKVQFDATNVFRDLGLAEYKVVWDVNGDGAAEKQDASSFSYSYKEAKLYTVSVRFPGLNDYMYMFPLRVEQSDVPVCEISALSKGKSAYSFSVNFLESTAKITNYQFDVKDLGEKGKILDSIKTKDPSFDYQFPGGGSYSIGLTFMTDEGKKGTCESDDIILGATDFDIRYDLLYKAPQSPQFQTIPSSGPTSFADGKIVVGELPTIFQLVLGQITPYTTTTTTRKVFLDGTAILSTDDKTFEFRIDTAQDHVVRLVVEDSARGAKTEKTFTLATKRDAVVGKLVVKPDSVGTDPFTVTLDASTTVVNDPSDELIYFTWDFGDGEIKKNLSQGVIQHVYKYDNVKENGTYQPHVIYTTKKGLTGSISLATPIIVKKQLMTLKILIDTHPAQIASIGERVGYSISVNGLPKKIYWDFGNIKTLECSGRECIQAATRYEQPGTYTVKTRVVYENNAEVEGKVTIKIK